MRWEPMESVLRKSDDLQDVALSLYGRYDLDKSIIWMVEELGEFVSALRKNEGKARVSEELGDLFAWVLHLANILDLRLSASLAVAFQKEIHRQLLQHGKLRYDSQGRLSELLRLGEPDTDAVIGEHQSDTGTDAGGVVAASTETPES